MADESIGTARLDLVVSTDQFDAAIAASKRTVSDMSQAAQGEYDRLTSATKRYADGLIRNLQTIGLSREQMVVFNAEQRVGAEFAADLATQLRDQAAATAAAAEAAKRLSDAQAFEKQIASSRELYKSAEYVQFWNQTLDQMEATERRVAGQNAFLDSLRQDSAAIGKTRADLLELKAAQLGVTDQAAPFIAKLREQNDALGKGGISAAQQAAALRGLPAQLTDVVVSLQGGQRPLTVLLQQGGQVKDMFGGLVPAAKAVGGALLDLINPYTLAAGAVLALVAAYQAGASESTQFTKSLLQNGNSLGQTASGLADVATSIGQVTGSRGKAVDALNQIAASGLGAGKNVASIATAAVAMNQATGKAIDATLQDFESLKTGPAEALATLNEKTNFLTAAVYEQVASLERQGRAQEAVALAQSTYAQAVQDQAATIKRNLGTLETAWNTVAGAAGRAWEAMKGIGRAPTMSELNAQLKEATDRLQQLNAGAGFATNAGGAAFGDGGKAAQARAKEIERERTALIARIAMLQQQADEAAITGTQKWQEAEKIAAQQRLDAISKEAETNAQKRAREIAQVKADAALTGASLADQQKLIDQINEKYKDRAVKAFQDDAATKLLQSYRDGDAALQAQLDTQQKLGTWEQKRAEFEQQIADLKGKKILTADQQSLLANEQALRTQLDRNVADEKSLQLKQQAARLAALQQTLDERVSTDQRQYSDQEAAFGLGTKDMERLTAQTKIYRQYQDDLLRLTRDHTNNKTSDNEFEQQAAALKQNLDQRLALQSEYYAKVDGLQGDWVLGFKHAFADYVDAGRNAYQQAGEVFQSVTGAMGDAFANFVTTGKVGFKELANSILADLARIAARQAVVGAIGSIAGAIGGSFGGGSFTDAGGTVGGAALGGASSAGSSLDGFLSGGRASGGPTDPDSLYRVNEQGPELYSVDGKTYLMSGGRGGYVTPLQQSVTQPGATGGTKVDLTVIYQSDGQTQEKGQNNEFAKDMADNLKAYIDSRIMQATRQGGPLWAPGYGRTA